MFESAFERHIKDLARRSDLKIATCTAKSAKLLFTVNGHNQPLYVIPYDNVWEFSCPSMLVVDNPSEIPSAIMIYVLKENSKAKRGFWCVEEIQGKHVLEYMHNLPEAIITPDEFYQTCWGIVKQVDALEDMLRDISRRL